MTIPRTPELYSDVLEVIKSGKPVSLANVRESVRANLNLTAEEIQQKTRGGGNQIFANINWAISHLAQAEALTRPDKGFVQITELGKKLFDNFPNGISQTAIKETEGFQAWQERSRANQRARKAANVHSSTELNDFVEVSDPISAMQQAEATIRNDVASQLLDRIRNESPEFLEKLVLKLLLTMGYGANEDDLVHTGKSGDEGIDGIVRQDRLGLEKIYVQAKRYRDQSTIGGETIQAFMGALSMKNATKGVFISTSRFSSAALKYVEDLKNPSIVLIDGPELVNFMIDFGVGVTKVETYDVYTVDENYFGVEE